MFRSLRSRAERESPRATRRPSKVNERKHIVWAPTGSTVTRYKIASDGSLTELGSNTETKSEFAKTDSLLSSDSRFLYVLAPSVIGGNTSLIDEYEVGRGGSLTLIGQTPANLPVGISGLAGR